MPITPFKRLGGKILSRASKYLAPVKKMEMEPTASTCSQLLFQLELRRWVQDGRAIPRLGDLGFKVFSQTDEDGILLSIFSIIGAPHKTCVEICAADGIECNTSNLILNHGWHGLLVDGNVELVAKGREFYRHSTHTYVYPPAFVCAWVKRDGVNDLISKEGFSGDVDLLSIDLDGVDYWIWESITVISPRVVVVEYQAFWGRTVPGRSRTRTTLTGTGNP
jgi:hypothetical protein